MKTVSSVRLLADDPEIHRQDLYWSYKTFQELSEYTDVILHCQGGSQVSFHRAILCNASPFLKTLIQNFACCSCFGSACGNNGGTVQISLADVEKDLVDQLLELLYTGRVFLDSEARNTDLKALLFTLGIRLPKSALSLEQFGTEKTTPKNKTRRNEAKSMEEGEPTAKRLRGKVTEESEEQPNEDIDETAKACSKCGKSFSSRLWSRHVISCPGNSDYDSSSPGKVQGKRSSSSSTNDRINALKFLASPHRVSGKRPCPKCGELFAEMGGWYQKHRATCKGKTREVAKEADKKHETVSKAAKEPGKEVEKESDKKLNKEPVKESDKEPDVVVPDDDDGKRPCCCCGKPFMLLGGWLKKHQQLCCPKDSKNPKAVQECQGCGRNYKLRNGGFINHAQACVWKARDGMGKEKKKEEECEEQKKDDEEKEDEKKDDENKEENKDLEKDNEKMEEEKDEERKGILITSPNKRKERECPKCLKNLTLSGAWFAKHVSICLKEPQEEPKGITDEKEEEPKGEKRQDTEVVVEETSVTQHTPRKHDKQCPKCNKYFTVKAGTYRKHLVVCRESDRIDSTVTDDEQTATSQDEEESHNGPVELNGSQESYEGATDEREEKQCEGCKLYFFVFNQGLEAHQQWCVPYKKIRASFELRDTSSHDESIKAPQATSTPHSTNKLTKLRCPKCGRAYLTRHVHHYQKHVKNCSPNDDEATPVESTMNPTDNNKTDSKKVMECPKCRKKIDCTNPSDFGKHTCTGVETSAMGNETSIQKEDVYSFDGEGLDLTVYHSSKKTQSSTPEGNFCTKCGKVYPPHLKGHLHRHIENCTGTNDSLLKVSRLDSSDNSLILEPSNEDQEGKHTAIRNSRARPEDSFEIPALTVRPMQPLGASPSTEAIVQPPKPNGALSTKQESNGCFKCGELVATPRSHFLGHFRKEIQEQYMRGLRKNPHNGMLQCEFCQYSSVAHRAMVDHIGFSHQRLRDFLTPEWIKRLFTQPDVNEYQIKLVAETLERKRKQSLRLGTRPILPKPETFSPKLPLPKLPIPKLPIPKLPVSRSRSSESAPRSRSSDVSSGGVIDDTIVLHTDEDGMLRCFRCETTWPNKAGLKQHLVSHFRADVKVGFLDEESPKCCPICDYIAINPDQVVYHLALTHHKLREFLPKEIGDEIFSGSYIRSVDIPLLSTDEDLIFTRKCDRCSVVFRDRAIFTDHLKTCHWMCPKCGIRLNQAVFIKKHQSLCAGTEFPTEVKRIDPKPTGFHCPVCPRVINWISSFKMHLCTHFKDEIAGIYSGSSDKCDLCVDFRPSKPSHLLIHMGTKHGYLYEVISDEMRQMLLDYERASIHVGLPPPKRRKSTGTEEPPPAPRSLLPPADNPRPPTDAPRPRSLLKNPIIVLGETDTAAPLAALDMPPPPPPPPGYRQVFAPPPLKMTLHASSSALTPALESNIRHLGASLQSGDAETASSSQLEAELLTDSPEPPHRDGQDAVKNIKVEPTEESMIDDEDDEDTMYCGQCSTLFASWDEYEAHLQDCMMTVLDQEEGDDGFDGGPV